MPIWACRRELRPGRLRGFARWHAVQREIGVSGRENVLPEQYARRGGTYIPAIDVGMCGPGMFELKGVRRGGGGPREKGAQS